MSVGSIAGTFGKAQTARSHANYKDFLYAEAVLPDEWRLNEWYAQFTGDAIKTGNRS